jgi:phosphoserine phosphatase RsbU/P
MLNLSLAAAGTDGDVRGSQAGPRPTARILISDDQHDVLAALSLLLKIHRFETETVCSPEAALNAAQARSFDLLLLDLNYTRDTTSGHEGLELLSSLRGRGITAPIVVMTAWGNVELAVEAMRLGATDFVQKPWDNSRLLATIEGQLKQAETRKRQVLRRRSELEIARHVQEKLLPQSPKKLASADYSATCRPAHEVGGDYYDIFDLAPQQVAGLLADVSGKGVAAAMLMANLQACFRTQFEAGRTDAHDVLASVNRLFYATTPPEQYVTLFYFEYDDQQGILRYSNCGHLPPVLIRANGAVERLNANATVIGLFSECKFECESLRLNKGDVLAVFTDGVTEFLMQDGEEFGDDRFIDLLGSVRTLAVDAALQHLNSRIEELSGCSEQADDRTILLMKVR